MLGAVRILAVAAAVGAAAVPEANALTRAVEFAGRQWLVKADPGLVGPGPNSFSGSTENVWVDRTGRLHLAIRRGPDGWTCAEVVGTESLGYGRYSWTLDSAVDGLDPNVVLGLFTWSDDPAFAHREIDIEFARWGWPEGANAQFVVQPFRSPGHLRPFRQSAATTSRHTFTWTPGRVTFTTTSGALRSWSYASRDVPPAGGERPRMNLWLFESRPPSDGRPVEVVIRDFTFTPLADFGRGENGRRAGRGRR